MLSKLLGSSVAVIGLLLAGPQKASADVIFACVNTTTGLLYVVSATTNCPPPTSGATWIKINWNATAGGQADNVAYTALVNIPGSNTPACSVLNVNAQPRTVHIELVNDDGSVAQDMGTPTLGAGAGSFVRSLKLGFLYCKFTVTNGTSSDIRGTMQICGPDTLCGQVFNTVAAQ
jgi:hypothetical protein